MTDHTTTLTGYCWTGTLQIISRLACRKLWENFIYLTWSSCSQFKGPFEIKNGHSYYSPSSLSFLSHKWGLLTWETECMVHISAVTLSSYISQLSSLHLWLLSPPSSSLRALTHTQFYTWYFLFYWQYWCYCLILFSPRTVSSLTVFLIVCCSLRSENLRPALSLLLSLCYLSPFPWLPLSAPLSPSPYRLTSGSSI